MERSIRLTDLEFADDAVIFAETESDLAAFLGAQEQKAKSGIAKILEED